MFLEISQGNRPTGDRSSPISLRGGDCGAFQDVRRPQVRRLPALVRRRPDSRLGPGVSSRRVPCLQAARVVDRRFPRPVELGTFAGIATDASGQATDGHGRPIGGLYAVG